MAQKRRKKEAKMGRSCIIIGLVCKILQIIGAALSVDFLVGTLMTLITTCLLVGGLAVLAVEKMNITGAFALISLVGIIGGILPTNNHTHSTVFMIVTFAAYALMLLFMGKKWRAFAGVTVALLTVLLSLQSFGIITMPIPAVTAVLVSIYGVMALGLLI